jgi:hypothetical protein
MNNILLNLFMYLLETICGYTEEKEIDNETKSYEPYFLYDLETFKTSPLYE